MVVSEAPLHPRRIADTIEALTLATAANHEEGEILTQDQYETCLHGLRMLRKAQKATGLTPEVADVGSHVLGVLDYVKKALVRK